MFDWLEFNENENWSWILTDFIQQYFNNQRYRVWWQPVYSRVNPFSVWRFNTIFTLIFYIFIYWWKLNYYLLIWSWIDELCPLRGRLWGPEGGLSGRGSEAAPVPRLPLLLHQGPGQGLRAGREGLCHGGRGAGGGLGNQGFSSGNRQWQSAG